MRNDTYSRKGSIGHGRINEAARLRYALDNISGKYHIVERRGKAYLCDCRHEIVRRRLLCMPVRNDQLLMEIRNNNQKRTNNGH